MSEFSSLQLLLFERYLNEIIRRCLNSGKNASHQSMTVKEEVSEPEDDREGKDVKPKSDKVSETMSEYDN